MPSAIRHPKSAIEHGGGGVHPFFDFGIASIKGGEPIKISEPLIVTMSRSGRISIPVTPKLIESFRPHPARSIGAVYSENAAAQFLIPLDARKSFDALLFVEKTTAARPNTPLSRP